MKAITKGSLHDELAIEVAAFRISARPTTCYPPPAIQELSEPTKGLFRRSRVALVTKKFLQFSALTMILTS